MTDLDRLLAAILDNPADDTPRLMYADELDAQGQGERAEFVRVQIELARLSDCPRCQRCAALARSFGTGGDAYCHPCWRLRRRERALFEAHKRAWFGGDRWAVYYLPGEIEDTPLPDLTSAVVSRGSAVVSRGFVGEVRCRLAEWIGGRRSCATGINPSSGAVGHIPCSGPGRTPGIGPEVVRRHPVTTVRFAWARAQPSAQHSGWWQWYSGDDENNGEIPEAVYLRLEGEYPDSPHGRAKQPYWRSADDAHRALSAAAIAWARSHQPASGEQAINSR